MSAEPRTRSAELTSCPHCHKPFAAELIAGGVERHRGFKCPHCRLFIPESRVADPPLSRDRD